jgi:hypothetical protein
MEQIECSETSEIINQTPGNHPKEDIPYIACSLSTSLNVLALYHVYPGCSSALQFVLHLLHGSLMLSELVLTDSLQIAHCVRLRTHNGSEPTAAFLPVQVNHRTAEPSLVARWKKIYSDLRYKI